MPKQYNTSQKRLSLLSETSLLASAEMTSDLDEEIRVLNQFLTDMINVLTPDQVTTLLIKKKEYIEEDENELFTGASDELRSIVLGNLTAAIDQPVTGE